MTLMEEYLFIYSTQLENMLLTATDPVKYDILVDKASKVASRTCLNDKTREEFEKCENN